MATDRTVRWKASPPSLEDLDQTLRCYVDAAAKEVRWDSDGHRFYAVLKGRPRHPFEWDESVKELARALKQHDERWFEVYVDDRYVDVITRGADEFTMAVAEGFAALIARRWDGRRE